MLMRLTLPFSADSFFSFSCGGFLHEGEREVKRVSKTEIGKRM
jgi:hypothetical protein